MDPACHAPSCLGQAKWGHEPTARHFPCDGPVQVGNVKAVGSQLPEATFAAIDAQVVTLTT